MEVEKSESSLVPESVMEPVRRTLAHVEELRAHFAEFMSLSANPEVLDEMPPLRRAETLFLLAKATTILFVLKLRCSGVNPDDHPVKSELERLSLYEDKLNRLRASSKAPIRPSTKLNAQAATRVIGHSLPDLTPEQRKSMTGISKREDIGMTYRNTSTQKKRKLHSTKRKSVQTEAKEFLEKASQELLGFGDDMGGFKGPLRMDTTEADDE